MGKHIEHLNAQHAKNNATKSKQQPSNNEDMDITRGDTTTSGRLTTLSGGPRKFRRTSTVVAGKIGSLLKKDKNKKVCGGTDDDELSSSSLVHVQAQRGVVP